MPNPQPSPCRVVASAPTAGPPAAPVTPAGQLARLDPPADGVDALLWHKAVESARIHSTLPGYLRELEAHCRPLAAAHTQGHLLLSSFQPGPDATADVFATICAAAEAVRIRRRGDPGPYACAVLAWLGSAAADGHDDLIAYPAHLARCLYAPAGLVVADFAPGPPRPGRRGQPVPAPPVALVVIRARRTRRPRPARPGRRSAPDPRGPRRRP